MIGAASRCVLIGALLALAMAADSITHESPHAEERNESVHGKDAATEAMEQYYYEMAMHRENSTFGNITDSDPYDPEFRAKMERLGHSSRLAEEEAIRLHGETPVGGDQNPLCAPWARSGECMRNPQYMWQACAHACGEQNYVDTDELCSAWTESGECENNPEFMLNKCNASCVNAARNGMNRPRQVRKNPHLGMDEEDDGSAARLYSFMPVFILVTLLGALGIAVRMRFAELIAEKQTLLEESWARFTVRVQRNQPRLAPLITSLSVNAVARFFISLYFINEAITVAQTNPALAFLFMDILGSDGVWQEHGQLWVDISNICGGIAAALCVIGLFPLIASVVMMFDIIVDSYLIISRIFWTFIYGRGLYINELMAKKFSLLGCVAMLIAVIVQSRQKRPSFPGLLTEARDSLSNSLSIVLLLGRLLIAVLFLYVGLSELHRLLFQPYTPYLPGDGHDVVWPKAVELLLAIPFTLGFETSSVSRWLAVSLVLEALYAWSWWRMAGDHGAFAQHRRAIHYREHFMTNIATAGGLLLLQKMGGGKYTVDELLKKKD
mmetsp:Transcript_61996/g.103059  ORF Transcript_61996/g.103059 Transcript_61996/m.103059 type:complete len:553 (+) Transcript_61996:11-1669(+)|eukprot:CAMPEP_0119300766 /NCGR_PEP_ID=MMETSP1333-20130426/2671_1 /TAXON_ID=418940 /ORGANISM="Scyphosphaera apsteinii, Strain RCC1455" /LENGTH=552 /DNA_ID=CAMNT_0007302657 /DNA_START=11 /DNA_END=1669 /DNA_ORIENTATION=+